MSIKVYIYCGVSGSGKSTHIRANHPTARVCSADDFFLDSKGFYYFLASLLPVAHGKCLRTFVEDLQNPNLTTDIVVDNTNTTVAEIAPYAALALAYGAELQIVTLMCDVETATARNTHNVPHGAIVRMATNLASRELPPWWSHKYL